VPWFFDNVLCFFTECNAPSFFMWGGAFFAVFLLWGPNQKKAPQKKNKKAPSFFFRGPTKKEQKSPFLFFSGAPQKKGRKKTLPQRSPFFFEFSHPFLRPPDLKKGGRDYVGHKTPFFFLFQGFLGFFCSVFFCGFF